MVRAINLAIALLMASAVTFGLFFLMQFLIAMDATEPERGEATKIADITMPDIEIEGWCQVMFTVDENGGVQDAVVVDADPPNIFDSASLRAVARFKFNPRTEDGQGVKTPGVQYVFRFNLAAED